MTKRRKKWITAMMLKYDTDEAGVSEIMAERQRQSVEARKLKGVPHRGGFSNKELAKKAGELGRQTRWGLETPNRTRREIYRLWKQKNHSKEANHCSRKAC